MTRRIAFAVSTLFLLPSACASSVDSLNTCLQREGDDVDIFEPTLTGVVADDTGFVDGRNFCTPLANSLAIQTGVGRARFSWDDDAITVPVLFGEAVWRDIFTEFNGRAALVMEDDLGLAVAFAAAGVAPAIDDLVVEHGAVTAWGNGGCGSWEATKIKVTLGDQERIVDVGESAALRVDDVPFTFHAIASARSTTWRCTDGGPSQSWALTRDAE